jgi:hypothetical protein
MASAELAALSLIAHFFAGANAMLPLDPTETVKVEKLEGRTTQVSQHKRTLGL